tara:strand:+ start:37 stop:348 length:312 start_codon:yes stop_codon:yes gene_type:complete
MIENLKNKIPKFLQNKYLIIIILFLIWIAFIDNNNLIKQYKFKQNIKSLKEKKQFYINEIYNDSIELSDIINDSNKREKFAREKFLMKKENEDIYIIRKKENE